MSAPSRARQAWRRGQRGWPARFPLAQLPNPPLLVALGGGLVAARTGGPVRTGACATTYAALSIWGWEELTDGANPVRQVMGVGALVFVVGQIHCLLRDRHMPRL